MKTHQIIILLFGILFIYAAMYAASYFMMPRVLEAMTRTNIGGLFNESIDADYDTKEKQNITTDKQTELIALLKEMNGTLKEISKKLDK